jgi:hypothetical protein
MTAGPTDPNNSSPSAISETDKEWAFRDRELVLKKQEVEIKEQERKDKLREIEIKEGEYGRSRWTNPLVVAIFAASLAAAGNAAVAYFNASAQRTSDASKASTESALEDRKAEFARILEAIKIPDDQRRTALVEYLIHHNLITDPKLIESMSVDIATQNVQLKPIPPPPPPPTTDTDISKTFDISVVPALDGEGNSVGIVGPSKVQVNQTRQGADITSARFTLSSQFYNGSGTWRGSQNVVLTFIFENGAKQESSPIFLDRSRCFYGKAMPFTSSGTLDLSKGVVSSVNMVVSRVTGVQTPC